MSYPLTLSIDCVYLFTRDTPVPSVGRKLRTKYFEHPTKGIQNFKEEEMPSGQELDSSKDEEKEEKMRARPGSAASALKKKKKN